MTSQPTSGPGSGVIASKLTTITSAQLKALFTTPVTVSPTPRSDEIIMPIHYAATAEDSTVFYDNPALGTMALMYSPSSVSTVITSLLAALTSGDPSFRVAEAVAMGRGEISGTAGLALVLSMDTANLTSGDFPVAFTLFYAVIPS